jgi:hypothetical protein
MPAGMVRFVCILISMLALLNARHYTQKEIIDREKYQKDVYGSEFFPGLSTVQRTVFKDSLVGPQIQKHLAFLLIKPTSPEKKELRRAKNNW